VRTSRQASRQFQTVSSTVVQVVVMSKRRIVELSV
jgi:hypothetical protein